jgi:ADP-ribosyl-[dinitrogen reductase] hydrolase
LLGDLTSHSRHGRSLGLLFTVRDLALLGLLLACDQLNLDDFSLRLLAWYREGYLAVDGVFFDVGVQTQHALESLANSTAASVAGPAGERDNGNGSLMRVWPLALWHRRSDQELVAEARRQSLVTHGHLRAQLCCALYCLWARRVLEGAADPWHAAVQSLHGICGEQSAARRELEEEIRPG